ncbi:unnamed protein product, partial [Prorocentrum cordatum]
LGGRAATSTERLRYDETPMYTRLTDREQLPAPAARVPPADGAVQQRQQVPVSCTCETSHIAKLLNTQRSYAMLFEAPGHGMVAVHVPMDGHIQSMARATAEVLHESTERSSPMMADIAALFERTQRIVTTDGASSITRFERNLSRERRASSSTLKITREIRRAHGFFKTVLSQVKLHTAMMVHVARALCTSDSMRLFRFALRRVISGDLARRENARHSRVDLENNTVLLGTFPEPPSGPIRLRRSVIMSLASGCWPNRRIVEHCCPGCCESRDDRISKFMSLFVACLAIRKPPVWPSSRWTGFGECTDWLGLLECCHGLLARTHVEWTGVDVAVLGGPLDHNFAIGMYRAGDHELDEDGDGHAAGGGGQQGGGQAARRNELSLDDRRQEESKHRAHGARWLWKCFSLAHLVLIRRVLKPMLRIMNLCLKLAGDAHCRLVDFRNAQRASGIGPDMIVDGCPLIAASRLLCETELFNQLQFLMSDPREWAIVPVSCRISSLRKRAFLLLSQLGCMCNVLRELHQCYPFKLFRLVGGPQLTTEIADDCEDLKDDLGKAGHATIRRSLVGLSAQAHAVHIKRLSAQGICELSRKKGRRLRSGSVRPARKTALKTLSSSAAAVCQRRRRGHGGAGRALRDSTLGTSGRPDLHEASLARAALGPEEKAEHARAGAIATRATRAGAVKPFGDDTRRALRRVARDRTGIALAEMAESRQALCSVASAAGQTELAAPAGVCSVGAGPSAAETSMASVVGIKRQLRLEPMRRSMGAWGVDGATVRRRDARGQRFIQSTFGQMGATASGRAEFAPCTSSGAPLTSFVWESLSIAQTVSRALSCGGSSSRSQLTDALNNIWSGFHETVDHVDRPEWADDGPAPKPCTRAGFCVCAGPGRDVKTFIAGVNIAVERACPVGPRRKQLHPQAECFIFSLGQRQPTEDNTMDVNLDTDRFIDGLPHAEEVRYHIGHQRLTPWRSDFHMVRYDFSSGAFAVPSRARLSATSAFSSSRWAMRDFDRSLRWRACVYKVSWKRDPMGTVAPDCVDVELPGPPAGAGAPVCRVVWLPPWAIVKRKRENG